MKLCLRCNQYFEDGIELCPIDTSRLESVGEHPLIGALINDRYVVDSVIGKGSSGIVYKATRLLMGREVAVKVLHSYLGADTGSLDRFLREAKAAGRLKHPNIINIWESGVTDDAQPYFVMDYLEGVTLADLIREKDYVHAGRAMPIMRQVCDALAEAHRQGIVHRDIKPENIVLQANEGDFDDFVKVLDFGIADQPTGQEQHQRQKTAAGSPAYMSPEQCQGFRLDHRSDIYSLGIVVFELLTGARPFNSDDVMSLFKMHVAKRPPSLSTVRPDGTYSAQLDAVLFKALAKKPEDRHQTVTEFWKELEEALLNIDAPGKKKADSAADRFAVADGERLTVSTGQQKFLPGPEEMMGLETAEEVGTASGNQKTTAQSQDDTSAGANKDPEVSAAVNRLLKSAKRTAEAFRTSADPPSVSNWARDVLTRPTESGQYAVEQDPTNQPQGEPEKAQPSAAPAGGQRVGDKPDVSKWAQQVLNRGDEKEAGPGNASPPGNANAPSNANAPGNNRPAADKPTPAAPTAPAAPTRSSNGEPLNPVRPPLGQGGPGAAMRQGPTAALARQAAAQSPGTAPTTNRPAGPGGPGAPGGASAPAGGPGGPGAPRPLQPGGPTAGGVAGPRPPQGANALTPGNRPPGAPPLGTAPQGQGTRPPGAAPQGNPTQGTPPPGVRPPGAPLPPGTRPPGAPGPQGQGTRPPGAPPPGQPSQRPPQGAPPGAPGAPRPQGAAPGAPPAQAGQRPPQAGPGPGPGAPRPPQAPPGAPGPQGQGVRPPGQPPQPGAPRPPQPGQPPQNRPPQPGAPGAPGMAPSQAGAVQRPPQAAPPNRPVGADPNLPLKSGDNPTLPTQSQNAPRPTPAARQGMPGEPPARPSAGEPPWRTTAESSGPAAAAAKHEPNIEPDASNPFADAVDKVLDASILPEQRKGGQSKADIPLDPKRFDEPVNKPPEVANKFTEAVEKALDAAILPQAKENAKRSLDRLKAMQDPNVIDEPRSETSSQQLERFEQPISQGGSLRPDLSNRPRGIDESIMSSMDISRFSHPLDNVVQPPARPIADASRFDKPVAPASSGAGSGAPAASPSPAKPATPVPPTAPVPPSPAAPTAPAAHNQELSSAKIDISKFDPARFDQPVNKGQATSHHQTAFDKAVDRVLKPTESMYSLPASSPVDLGINPPSTTDQAIARFGQANAKSSPTDDAISRFAKQTAKPSAEESAAEPSGVTSEAAPTGARTNEAPKASELQAKTDEAFRPPATSLGERFRQAVEKPPAEPPEILAAEKLAEEAPKAELTDQPTPTPKTPAEKSPFEKSADAPISKTTGVGFETGKIDISKFDLPIKRSESTPSLANSPAVEGPAPAASTPGPEPGPLAEPPSPFQAAPQAPSVFAQASPTASSTDTPSVLQQPAVSDQEGISSAVSRLIEAAKRAPEAPPPPSPAPAPAVAAKPEALNRKIEAVKKRIEELKGETTGANAVLPSRPATIQPELPKSAAVQADQASLSDAVNRLLEAAQNKEQTIPPTPSPFQQPSYTSPPNPFSQSSEPPNHYMSQSSADHLAAAQRASESVQNMQGANQQQEPLTRAAEMINALKANKNYDGGTSDYYSGFKVDPKALAEKNKQARQGRSRVRTMQARRGLPIWALALIAVLAIGGAVWYAKPVELYSIAMSLINKQPAPTIDQLIQSGRYAEAKDALEKKRTTLKDPDKITTLQDKLDDVYVKLASKDMEDKNYDDALKELQKITKKSKHYRDARKLIRDCKKASLEEKPAASDSGSNKSTH